MSHDPDALVATEYFVYRPGRGTFTGFVALLPQTPSHDDIENIVAPIVGGRMLHLAVLFENAPASMFVYEFRDRESFELNDAATAVFRQAALRADPAIDPQTLPVINGSAVVFERILFPILRITG